MDEEAIDKVTELYNHWFGFGIRNDWQPLHGGPSFTHDLSNMLTELGYRKEDDIRKNEREKILGMMGTTFQHGFEVRYLHEREYQALKEN